MRNIYSLSAVLEGVGLDCVLASNGVECLESLKEDPNMDCILMDIMMPEMDGYETMQKIREQEQFKNMPIIALTANAFPEDREEYLEAGLDDYLAKPYAFSELLARVEGLPRRAKPSETQSIYKLADLELNLLTRKVTREGQDINLQPREFRLLEYFMKHADQVVTRTMLLENVWDYHFDPQTNVVDVHISRLRGKIDKSFSQALLHTVRGAGYMLRASD